MRKLPILLINLLASSMIASAVEPTDVRTWKSNNGKSIIGRATALDGETVTMILISNKTVRFPITKLEIMQQMFIKDHFLYEDEDEVSDDVVERKPSSIVMPFSETAEKPKKARSSQKNGRVTALRQSSKDDSFYFYYVPTTAAEEGMKPAMFWTSPGQTNERAASRFALASELTGMTIVLCGNSSNKGRKNSLHMGNNITHAITQLDIDEKRLFFAGRSGGGQRSLQNADRFKCAGAMPSVAYLGSTEPSKSGHYYVIGGAHDYNRYASAHIAKVLGKNAIHTLTPGGHGGVDAEGLNDGIIWLYTCNAYLKKTATREELSAFENRFYNYLTSDLEAEPWRAYYWADHMLNKCKMGGENKSKFQSLYSDLKSDAKNVLYLEGKEELEKFSEKYLSNKSSGTLRKHTNKEVKKAAAKLAEKYSELPRLRKIAQDLQKKTD